MRLSIRFSVLTHLLKGVFILLTLIEKGNGQTAVCSCSPSVYTITVNYNQLCSGTPVSGNGIAGSSCNYALAAGTGTVTNFVATGINYISFVEIKGDYNTENSQMRQGPHANGAVLSFTSVSATTGITDNEKPRAMQIEIQMTNSNAQTVSFYNIISFTRDCNYYPVLSVGQTMALMSFTALTPPRTEYCTAYVPPPPPPPPPPPAPVCPICDVLAVLAQILEPFLILYGVVFCQFLVYVVLFHIPH